MLIVFDGKYWSEAGSVWNRSLNSPDGKGEWIKLLCGNNWENDDTCLQIRSYNNTYIFGASENMRSNAGCKVGQSK
jgi:hypothetical protein